MSQSSWKFSLVTTTSLFLLATGFHALSRPVEIVDYVAQGVTEALPGDADSSGSTTLDVGDRSINLDSTGNRSGASMGTGATSGGLDSLEEGRPSRTGQSEPGTADATADNDAIENVEGDRDRATPSSGILRTDGEPDLIETEREIDLDEPDSASAGAASPGGTYQVETVETNGVTSYTYIDDGIDEGTSGRVELPDGSVIDLDTNRTLDLNDIRVESEAFE